MAKNKVISELSLVLVSANTFLVLANIFFYKRALVTIIIILILCIVFIIRMQSILVCPNMFCL